jgi:hypothetical protein
MKVSYFDGNDGVNARGMAKTPLPWPVFAQEWLPRGVGYHRVYSQANRPIAKSFNRPDR